MSSSCTPDRADPDALAVPASRYEPAPDLAVVTSYFNSHHYRSKRRAFDLFTRSMERSGVPLFIGECAFADTPFELAASENVFQFRSRDVIWQKERLLNLTIERVPERYSKIAWIDADILFDNPLWAVEASERLDTVPVLQLFAHGIRLRQDEERYAGGGERNRSFSFVQTAMPALARFGNYYVHGQTGLAWAGRRELLASHGLYDAAIAGSADHLMAHAFAGDFSSTCLPLMFGDCAGFLNHFREWAQSAWDHVRGRLGYVPGAALHLWHGDLLNRRYSERYRVISKIGFDPAVNLRLEPNGLWAWSDETAPALREWSNGYFHDRYEDTPDGVPVKASFPWQVYSDRL